MQVATPLGPIYVQDLGGGERPAALLWPSLFVDHRMWRPQVEALTGAGWRTLALDPPGHGRSPGPGRSFTMDECAEVVLRVLDAAGVRTPALLLGTSWGGVVAPRVALRAPDRVRAMALFNTTAEAPDLPTKANAMLLGLMLRVQAIARPTDRMIASLVLARGTRAARPWVEADFLRGLGALDRAAMIRSVQSVLVERDGVLDRLYEIEAPSLIVSGAQDTVLPTRLSLRMAERLPHARHLELPAVAHLAPIEAPEAVNARLLDFICELGPA